METEFLESFIWLRRGFLSVCLFVFLFAASSSRKGGNPFIWVTPGCSHYKGDNYREQQLVTESVDQYGPSVSQQKWSRLYSLQCRRILWASKRYFFPIWSHHLFIKAEGKGEKTGFSVQLALPGLGIKIVGGGFQMVGIEVNRTQRKRGESSLVFFSSSIFRPLYYLNAWKRLNGHKAKRTLPFLRPCDSHIPIST